MPSQPESLRDFASSWTCTEQLDWNLETSSPEDDSPVLQSAKRRQQCEVRNMCVDAKGAFVLSPKNVPPPINLIAADKTSDKYFQPRRVSPKKSLQAHFINETLFVYGHYSPAQFTHWLYNGVMPLQTTFDSIELQKEWEMDDLFPPSHITENGRRIFANRELVLHPEEIMSEFQSLPPRDAPICFDRAVIGLGSQCPFNYCEQNIPSSLYTDYQTSVSQFYWPTRSRWIDHLLTRHRGIEEWKYSIGWGRYEEPFDNLGEHQQAVNAAWFLERNEGTPLQCLWNTMYLNFEEDPAQEYRMWIDPLLRHSQEPSSRIGVADPDRVYRKREQQWEEEVGDRKPRGDRRKIVVAIIQREKSRTLINVDELTHRLISEGYRVKRITMDHGCGIPQTAYLLRDVDLLISPYGNALGTSIFLPRRPHVTTVSIDTSYAPENRFIWTTTAIGQRYLQHHFGPDFESVARQNVERERKTKGAAGKEGPGSSSSSKTTDPTDDQSVAAAVATEMARLQARYPLVQDMRLARKIRDQIWGQPGHRYAKLASKLRDQDLARLIALRKTHHPEDEDPQLVRRLGGLEPVEAFRLEYWRASARYVDVEQMVRIAAMVDREARELTKGRRAVLDTNNNDISNDSNGSNQQQQQQRVPYTFLDLCRENRCCGSACEPILRRTLVGNQAALGMHAQPGPEWGYYRGSDGVLRPQKTPEDQANEHGPGQLLNWKLEL
ncbi:hypothetical protein DFQ26_005846 [Actinomortierella ambigua]|nr:hypothetical protein DFQ26_005846 [Actinomortierella ambigua]